MGTQPSRKLAKRGPKIRTRKLRNDLKDSVGASDFKKASSQIEKAVIKSGGTSFLAGIVAAGIIAIRTSRESPQKSLKDISGESVTKLPTAIKEKLTLAGRDSINLALYNSLLKREK